jgi:hypothetical protein
MLQRVELIVSPHSYIGVMILCFAIFPLELASTVGFRRAELISIFFGRKSVVLKACSIRREVKGNGRENLERGEECNYPVEGKIRFNLRS